jgi:hypothetical protein
MLYPEKFYKVLDKKSVSSLTKNQIKNLFIEVINLND